MQTKRDAFLVDVERSSLAARIIHYFDKNIPNEEIARKHPEIWVKTRRYDPPEVRKTLLSRGMLRENIVRHAYRPFDIRWIYWEPETKLLGEKSPGYWLHAWSGNPTLSAQQKPRREWQPPQVVQNIAGLDLIDRGSSNFPLALSEVGNDRTRPNLSLSIENYLKDRALPPETVFYHIIATLHAPTYREQNAGALRMDWPRIPLPHDAATLRASADLGAMLARFLDPETQAPGVSVAALRAGLRVLGLPTKRGGAGLQTADLGLTAGWGSAQFTESGNPIVMPGRGLIALRDYSERERAALEAEGMMLGLSLDEMFVLLGSKTLDVHLNSDAWWTNLPEKVWAYTLGGYQVIKKWLSYREHSVLGRELRPDEVAYVSDMVRRIAAVLLMGPALDANYARAKANAVAWEDGKPAATGRSARRSTNPILITAIGS